MKSYDTELALVAGLMKDNSLIMDIDLLPDEFAFEEPRQIYNAIQVLATQHIPADIITVAEYMEANMGGAHWFERISNYVVNTVTVNLKTYAASIRDGATKRRAAEIAHILAETAGEGQGAVDKAIHDLMEIGRTKRKYNYTIAECLTGAVEDIEELNEKGSIPGVKTGINPFDSIIGGLHDTDLIVIGARPSMGKTAFLLNCALGAQSSVGIISSEQGYRQIGSRILAIEGRINAQHLRTPEKLGDAEYARMAGVINRVAKESIFINDMPSPTIGDIMRQARQWKFRNDIKALYVDYIQRIKTEGDRPRHEQIGDITMKLKELARELEIPVMALAQVSRNVEQRADKRPGMSDLKDSGTIEQEADVIATLYRDEVYDAESPEKGIVEIGIKKNRHGVTGVIRAAWLAEYMRVEELAYQEY